MGNWYMGEFLKLVFVVLNIIITTMIIKSQGNYKYSSIHYRISQRNRFIRNSVKFSIFNHRKHFPLYSSMVKQVTSTEGKELGYSVNWHCSCKSFAIYYIKGQRVLMKAIQLLPLFFKYDNGIKITFLKMVFIFF